MTMTESFQSSYILLVSACVLKALSQTKNTQWGCLSGAKSTTRSQASPVLTSVCVCNKTRNRKIGELKQGAFITWMTSGGREVDAEGVFFFFGRTFDLVSGRYCNCACAVPHPLSLWRACWTWSSKTTSKKTAVEKIAIPQVILATKN